jgi:DNA-binding NarL/FixJ family response regulator
MVDKKNLLIVDNTSSMTSPWKTDLRNYFNLIEVVGGFEALSKLKANNISCVLVNLSIQSFNGLDVVIKLRGTNKQIPMIVLAEKNDVRYIKDATQYGIHGYFLQPVNGQDLLNNVAKFTQVNLTMMANQQAQTAVSPPAAVPPPQPGNPAQQPSDVQEAPVAADSNGEVDINALYYEGQSSLLNQDLDKAMGFFDKIFHAKRVKDSERKYWEESIYQLGRCLIKRNKYSEAVEKMKLFMQRAPNSDLYKQAYFMVAECYENTNQAGKAMAIYKKLVDMPPFDSVTTKSRKKIKALHK